MYCNVVESNLRVMKLSGRRIISLRALYSPPRQSVIGYIARTPAGEYLCARSSRRDVRVRYSGLRVNYSFANSIFIQTRVGLLTLDCGPLGCIAPVTSLILDRYSNWRRIGSLSLWIIISWLLYRFPLWLLLTERSIARCRSTTRAGIITTGIERRN